MRGVRIIGIAAAVAVAGVGAVSGAMPASAREGQISAVSGPAAFPGLATEFDTVTIVDGATGDVIGSRPNVGTRIGIVGPGCTTTSLCMFSSPYRGYQGAGSMAVSVAGVAISGGPVTVVSVAIF